MSQDDICYYQRRAEAELERAQRATHRNAVAAHFQLANAYLDRIGSTQTVEPVRDV